jgi:hypothetical protein
VILAFSKKIIIELIFMYVRVCVCMYIVPLERSTMAFECRLLHE